MACSTAAISSGSSGLVRLEKLATTLPWRSTTYLKKFQRGVTDQALCARTITESLPPFFDYLESEIRGKPYFADDRFTIADIAVASVMANYRHSGEELDAARWPQFAAYVAKILSRPSFRTVLAEEQKLIDIARSR